MKKLLGIIGILGLAAVLLPVQGYADLRGAFAPLTIASGFVNGAEQPALRSGNTIAIAGQGTYERFFAFSTRSLVPGSEQVRSVYLHLDSQQSGSFVPLLEDPSLQSSFADPAWSFDGKYLAYVQLDALASTSNLYVQEYMLSTNIGVAGTPVGAAILVVAGGTDITPRHPDWSPSPNYTLAYDNNNTTLSKDIYTIDVFPTLGVPVRRTFSDIKAEQNPAWAPNGHDICFSSNQFGPNVLQIIDLNLPANDPGYTRLAETNFAFVSHNNACYLSDGNGLMYDAPTGEDPSGVTDVWILNLINQTKCEIQFDNRSDSDPDVSMFVNHTMPSDGNVPYNGFVFTSQAANFGVHTWRGTPVTSCLAPLPMGVETYPTVVGPSNSDNQQIVTYLTFPQQTKDAGYQCTTFNGPAEGVRNRASILVSPQLLALPNDDGKNVNPATGNSCFDDVRPGGEIALKCFWDRKTVEAQIVALGLTDQVVPLKMTAYSNLAGRGFQGFAYIKFTKSNQAGSSVALLGNSPNPFNPVTTIKFSVATPGNVTLRIFNVHGQLVKTLASGHYEAGVHEATWDGLTVRGNRAGSGVYYAKITGANNGVDQSRLVMAK